MANNSAYLYLHYESFADTIVRNILQKELQMAMKGFWSCAFFQALCFVTLLLAIQITV